MESFDSALTAAAPSGNVRLDNDLSGLFACNTGFALVGLIASLRAWDWRRSIQALAGITSRGHPRVTIQGRANCLSSFAKIVARRLDARDALFLLRRETAEEVESCPKLLGLAA